MESSNDPEDPQDLVDLRDSDNWDNSEDFNDKEVDKDEEDKVDNEDVEYLNDEEVGKDEEDEVDNEEEEYEEDLKVSRTEKFRNLGLIKTSRESADAPPSFKISKISPLFVSSKGGTLFTVESDGRTGLKNIGDIVSDEKMYDMGGADFGSLTPPVTICIYGRVCDLDVLRSSKRNLRCVTRDLSGYE